jgi:hypothetical protein
MRQLAASLAAAAIGTTGLRAEDLRVVNLRCEHQADPIGIDVPQPRLSWQLASDGRGVEQAAYRVVVSSAPDREGDLWDSGKVMDGRSVHVRYAGQPLRSFQSCSWKVQVWTGDAEAWSAPARWTMGIVPPDAWPAGWIGAGAQDGEAPEGAGWIWTPDEAEGLMHPPGTRYFRWKVKLPDASAVADGTVVMTADNGFVLYVNGRQAGSGGDWGRLERIDVARFLQAGDNVLALVVTNAGDRPSEAGAVGRLAVTLGDGTRVSSTLDASVLTSAAGPAGWETSGFDDSGWKPARVLGPFGMQPWGRPSAPSEALPLLRRALNLSKPVRRAVVHLCGLGFHELRINGTKVGEDELEPGWTNYRKTCLYSSYDVTPLLKPGANALGVMLGNGMYNVTGGRYIKFRGSFGEPAFTAVLRIEYADGTAESVASDASWKCAPGPVVFTCIYGGEDYDARREQEGWDRPDFDDSRWTAALPVDGPGGRLTARSAPPVRVMEELSPAGITQPRPGIFVYDLGRNFSGWPALSVSGPAGATVKLVPGELLDAGGLVTQHSSGGPVWFSYTLRGRDRETWRPRFSYYGFRYVQVEGAVPEGEAAADSRLPRVHALDGHFLYPAAAAAGRFACSNGDANRVHDLILTAIKSNFKSVLTDCPHREKLGWLECAHLLAGCFMYNFDCAGFYEKIARDMREAQLDNGMVPDIAPEYTVFGGGFRDSPEWGSAMVIAPWRAYMTYGDTGILADNYESMTRYTAYLGSRATGHIVAHGLGDWYDIGPGDPGPSKLTSLGLTSTGVYYQDIEILRKAAGLLGREDDARSFAGLAEEVRTAFNAKFYHADRQCYDRDSQTGNAMPLFLGLVAPDERGAVLTNVVDSIRANGNRVTAGDVGFYYVVQALLEGGRSDVLYDMLCQTNGPGYMFQLAKGATSLTEAWDTNPASSQNHCMLGHIEEWFYSGLLGIRAAAPGFKRIVIRPAMPGGLSWAGGHYDSVYGRIASRWTRAGSTPPAGGGSALTMDVVIPPNTSATIVVPAKDAASVTESGKPALSAPGLKFLRMEDGAAVFAAGSGRYRFAGTPGQP